MNRIRRIAIVAVMAAALATPALAQQRRQQPPEQTYSAVSPADIQRLQDNVFQAGLDVQQLRSKDANRASQLQAQLDDLRDEVIYLKVKLRKEGSLQRGEYADVRDRLDDLRSQATNYTASYTPQAVPPPPAPPRAAAPPVAYGAPLPAAPPAPAAPAARPREAREARDIEVPSGTEMDVRLQSELDSGKVQVEDRFEATTMSDVTAGGRVVIPAGSVM